MGIIYFIIALGATMIGATAGLGGGIIIKPSLDALGHYNLSVIGILSSATVLSMAGVTTLRYLLKGMHITKTLIFLTIGAIFGGIIGKEIFQIVYEKINPEILTSIQAGIIIILLIISLFKDNIPRREIKSPIIILLTGLILGTLSSFLGIGGGPVNVALLCILFSMDIKEAAAGSIFIILFSQASKLLAVTLTTGFSGGDYSMLFFMVPAGIAGGFLGSWLNKKLSPDIIEKGFKVCLSLIILLNAYNIFSSQL